MTQIQLPIELKYTGATSDEHLISLYDLSQALIGFERSLALTTHFVVNDEIITQATSLKGASILTRPPHEGSFSVVALLLLGGAYKVATLKKDNPLGHVVHSVYDYLVHRVTGQKVDYDKSIRELYEQSELERALEIKLPKQSRLDSLAEKLEPPLTRMHRPITSSGTAEQAKVLFGTSSCTENSIVLDRQTFGGIKYKRRAAEIETISAKVSVFNPNTFNGRLFVGEEERTVPFFLTQAGRGETANQLIGESYSKNLIDRTDESAEIRFDVLKEETKLGRLLKYSVLKVRPRIEDAEVLDDDDDFWSN